MTLNFTVWGVSSLEIHCGWQNSSCECHREAKIEWRSKLADKSGRGLYLSSCELWEHEPTWTSSLNQQLEPGYWTEAVKVPWPDKSLEDAAGAQQCWAWLGKRAFCAPPWTNSEGKREFSHNVENNVFSPAYVDHLQIFACSRDIKCIVLCLL